MESTAAAAAAAAGDQKKCPKPFNMEEFRRFGDFYTALNEATELWEMTQVEENAVLQKRKNHHNAEITRLLLILIEQPTLERIPPVHFEFVERYISGDYTGTVNRIMKEDEFILLQSIVIACQTKNTEALIELEGELWPYFNSPLKDLLRILVRTCVKEYS